MPADPAVTLTETTQLPAAGIVAPDGKVTDVPPGGATASEAPQVVDAPPGFAMTTPLGNVSTSGAVRVATELFGLLSVMFSVEIPPALIVVGAKDLPSSGATVIATTAGTTVSVATEGATLLPLLVVNTPTGAVTTYVPPTAATTLVVTVQLPFDGIVAPEATLIVDAPTAALVDAAPQVLLALGTGAITTPGGKLVIRVAFNVATDRFGFVIMIVSPEVAPALIVAGANVMLTIGLLTASVHVVTLLLPSVTAPLRAIARPLLLDPVFMVMLVNARILPAKLEPVPSVAELPICQNTLQLWPPLMTRTCDADAVVSALPT